MLLIKAIKLLQVLSDCIRLNGNKIYAKIYSKFQLNILQLTLFITHSIHSLQFFYKIFLCLWMRIKDNLL